MEEVAHDLDSPPQGLTTTQENFLNIFESNLVRVFHPTHGITGAPVAFSEAVGSSPLHGATPRALDANGIARLVGCAASWLRRYRSCSTLQMGTHGSDAQPENHSPDGATEAENLVSVPCSPSEIFVNPLAHYPSVPSRALSLMSARSRIFSPGNLLRQLCALAEDVKRDLLMRLSDAAAADVGGVRRKAQQAARGDVAEMARPDIHVPPEVFVHVVTTWSSSRAPRGTARQCNDDSHEDSHHTLEVRILETYYALMLFAALETQRRGKSSQRRHVNHHRFDSTDELRISNEQQFRDAAQAVTIGMISLALHGEEGIDCMGLHRVDLQTRRALPPDCLAPDGVHLPPPPPRVGILASVAITHPLKHHVESGTNGNVARGIAEKKRGARELAVAARRAAGASSSRGGRKRRREDKDVIFTRDVLSDSDLDDHAGIDAERSSSTDDEASSSSSADTESSSSSSGRQARRPNPGALASSAQRKLFKIAHPVLTVFDVTAVGATIETPCSLAAMFMDDENAHAEQRYLLHERMGLHDGVDHVGSSGMVEWFLTGSSAHAQP